MNIRHDIGITAAGNLRSTGMRLGSTKVPCPFHNPSPQTSTKISQSLELPTQNYITGKLTPFHLPLPPFPQKKYCP